MHMAASILVSGPPGMTTYEAYRDWLQFFFDLFLSQLQVDLNGSALVLVRSLGVSVRLL